MNRRLITTLTSLTTCLMTLASHSQAQTITVQAAIQREKTYVGDPFHYQIIIDGHESEGIVDLTPLRRYSPQSTGGRSASQSSVTIINGRRRSETHRRYVMNYLLTPSEPGQSTIPAVTVEIAGEQYRTNPVQLTVLEPQTTDKLLLEAELSETTAYVGQPVILTVKWFIAASVAEFHFNIPALQDHDHFVTDDVANPPGSGGELFELALGDSPVVARKANIRHRNRDWLLVTFSKIIIPTEPGTIELARSSVSCDIEVQSRSANRRRDPFGNFFGANREYSRFHALAKPLSLTVRPLPTHNQPDDFTGLVGRYSVASTATPTSVSVGDPITLTLTITGDLLKLVDMPDLNTIPAFATNFKIPSEQSPPKTIGRSKLFTQTIRANNHEVEAIPPVPLSFFDVDSNEYVTTHSDRIPLEVKATRKVTAAQAEGRELAPLGREIESVKQGIAANYVGPDLLKNTAFSPLAALTQPRYLLLYAGPFLLLIVSTAIQLARRENPARKLARAKAMAASKALTALRRLDPDTARSADSPDSTELHEATANILRTYIGTRYNRTPQSLTARDCQELLQTDHDDEKLIEQFTTALEHCEHARFAGSSATDATFNKTELAALIKSLDRTATHKKR